MIKRLKYHEIDFEKYSKCLENACQNSDYAEEHFLKTVTENNFDLLVLNDYEAVMPVHWKKYFGRKIVLMPRICQYHGVFSSVDDNSINNDFAKFLLKNYIVAEYAFNKDNALDFCTRKKRSYFILKNSYENVRKNYSVHRRRNVRITEEIGKKIEISHDLEKEGVKEFFFSNGKGFGKKQNTEKYWELTKKLAARNLMEIFIIEYSGKIQSFAGIYTTKNQCYLSLFINDSKLLDYNIPSIMIDQIVRKNIEIRTFDFMGSVIPNVRKFNERFGAEYYEFPSFEYSRTSIIKQILNLKKLF